MQYTIAQTPLSVQPSPQLFAFVQRLNRNALHHEGPEQSGEARERIALPVVAQPVDDAGRPVAEPLAVVTRDLSTWGVGLVHEQPMTYDRLALQLNVHGEEAMLIGEVRWRAPLGPFYACGCQVVAKLDSFPTPPPPHVHCSLASPNRIDPPLATYSSPTKRGEIKRQAL